MLDVLRNRDFRKIPRPISSSERSGLDRVIVGIIGVAGVVILPENDARGRHVDPQGHHRRAACIRTASVACRNVQLQEVACAIIVVTIVPSIRVAEIGQLPTSCLEYQHATTLVCRLFIHVGSPPARVVSQVGILLSARCRKSHEKARSVGILEQTVQWHRFRNCGVVSRGRNDIGVEETVSRSVHAGLDFVIVHLDRTNV